jgi:hypothetical protein
MKADLPDRHSRAIWVDAPMDKLRSSISVAERLAAILPDRVRLVSTWPPWLGLMIAVQNITSWPFNCHLTDFTHGWICVLGVGAGRNGVAVHARKRRE